MLFRRKGDDAPNPNVPIEDVPGFPPAPPGWQETGLAPDVEAEVRGLIASNKKIQAVKVVREHTGFGLKDAKDLVDAIAAGRIAAPSGYPAPSAYGEPSGYPAPSGYPEPAASSLSDQVRAFEAAEDHASAVALVCAKTGMSPAEAESFIRTLLT